jgi:4'-phosphopantetheinyl transferase
MNKVYWLRRTLEDVPSSNSWLSAAEQQRLDALRIPKRRADWRLGRWTAKQAVCLFLDISSREHGALAPLEVRAAPSGAPEVFLRDAPANVTISISHRDGVCICTVGPARVELGCDVETAELRTAEFIADYFALNELQTVADAPGPDRMWLVPLIWSAKESALKALKEGLRADARSVQVSLGVWNYPVSEWSPLQVTAEGRLFRGWWKMDGNSVYTFAADPPISPPTLLIHREKLTSRAVNF